MIRSAAQIRRSQYAQRGYALLSVIFLAAVMIIVAAAAAPVLLTQGRREKEADMIWRGEQYARAVKLYYRKNGRFPNSIEDLEKPKNNLRYLRKAYKDPMNTEDGAWRLIYIAPNGQLIGSLTRTNLLLQLPAPQAINPPGTPPAAPGAGARPPSGPPAPSGPGTPVSSFGATQGNPVLGGNIIGVGSKAKGASLRVYNGGQTYKEWEFMWDPTKDQQPGGQQGQPGRPAGSPIQNPGGGIPPLTTPPINRPR